jgi:flagellar biosynthetic protein FliS
MNPVMSYRARRLDTASPIQMLVMLYQELLRRIEMGAMCIDDGQRMEALPHLHRAREILSELLGALDPVAAPQLCENLSDIYGWSMAELTVAGRSGDAAKARSVGRAIEPLLEGFQAVSTGEAR